MEKEDIQAKILRKLMAMNPPKWGGCHTEIINLSKGLPDHLRGTKVTKKAIKELFQLGFLIAKPSTGEIHVSLNPAKRKEIYTFLGLEL